ncbi:flagellar assembly protein FliH [Stappia taiwanensis]|uniref:Flagellar assembly protein FliH n=2 Tax=Stappia taiwanensis TaxID=992267 RepID=A0A838XIT8_9HYPH|nr:flagellar assembly protein FliH [Stappia taiwanensis]
MSMMTRLSGTQMKANRFLFDRNFAAIELPSDEPEEVEAAPEIPMIPLAEHEARLAAAEQAAYERGRAEVLAARQQTEQGRLADEARHLADEICGLSAQLDRDQARQEKDAVALAFLVARRICGHLIAREPLGEVVALISECLGPLRRAPHLVIRVREGDLAQLKAEVEPLVNEKGFEGRVVFLGEPELAAGDCRIEWADGGIVRDRRAIEKQVDQAARRYFEGRRAGKSPAQAVDHGAAEEAEDK